MKVLYLIIKFNISLKRGGVKISENKKELDKDKIIIFLVIALISAAMSIWLYQQERLYGDHTPIHAFLLCVFVPITIG